METTTENPARASMGARPPAPPPPPPKKPAKKGGKSKPIHEALGEVIADSENKEPVRESVSVNPFDEEYGIRPSTNPFDGPVSTTDSEVRFSRNTLRASEAVNPRPTQASSIIAPSETSLKSLVGDSSITSEKRNIRPHMNMTRAALGPGEPNNPIYHKIRFSDFWLVVFLILHTGQFLMLLVAASSQLPLGAFMVILILVISVIVVAIVARVYIKKSRLSAPRNVKLKSGVCTPDDEADDVPDFSVKCFALVAILEGIIYAIYASIVAGNSNHLDSSGYYTQGTILQIIRFASIILLALHRIIRPANRIDPLRTIMELEVVTVCWDAIDGSTLFELLDLGSINLATENAIRFLMAFWYFSVGVRMAIMFMTQLSPMSAGYKMVVTPPLQLAPQPTVDRTLQGLRLRAIVTMTMAIADFYAAIVRIILWSRGQLTALQQDMAIKNVMFIMACSGAYDMYDNTITRNWNSRDIFTSPVVIRYPKRDTQLSICKWMFVVSYLLIGALMSYILVKVSVDTTRWVGNVGCDILLCIIFWFYCKNIHVKADTYIPSNCLIPSRNFLHFPSKMGGILGAAMGISLLGVRIPGLYYNYSNMADSESDDFWTYDNALLLVSLCVIPIALYGTYWAIAYMLFRKEFTAAPGNYNAIHDPVIQMVSIASMTEGALDVLSCSTLMQLATNNLPSHMNGAIVLLALLEVINGCISFGLQCSLSGGHDDTPLDLVRWNAYFRITRAVIDAAAIVLRVVLWIQYNAVSSVFLVKNLYNLLHTMAQIERWQGVSCYPKDTLFSQFVSPQEWYGLTKEQWRFATNETVLDQARSGRKV